MTTQSVLASRPAALVLAISLVTGLSVPFVMMPRVHAAPAVPDGTVELSAAPVEQTKSVPPNIAVTFDDSGSMAWSYLSDDRPFDNKSWGSTNAPWRCAGVINPSAPAGTIGAHAMNGVYYNPNIQYAPPVYADGTSFPEADASLNAVINDEVTAKRKLDPSGVGSTTNFNNQVSGGAHPTTKYWQCYTDGNYSPDLGTSISASKLYGTTAPVGGGGPYYYQLKASALATLSSPGYIDQFGKPLPAGLNVLYNKNNWEAVAVPVSQYQNWANWWAYYRTRNQMARTVLSRVFGSPLLAANTDDGGYGADIRVAWQNINNADYKLPSNSIISALIDTSNCTTGSSANPKTTQQQAGSVTAAPNCYRSAFFNWIFQIGASGGTPLRSALKRVGTFFTKGNGNTGATGDLHDPYWQPPQTGSFNQSTNPGNELYCRQNYSLIITDGLWNTVHDGGPVSDLTSQPTSGNTLPDGVTFPDPSTPGVTSIYAPQHDSQYPSYVSLSDLAYNYWATDLRPDLYQGGTGSPDPDHIVTPYLPDTYTGLFGTGNVVGGNGSAKDISAEEYFNPNNDPATWPHMVSYNVGLGVSGILNFSDNTDCKQAAPVDQDACALRKGITNSNGSIGWPPPFSNGTTGTTSNIDDTWHAALAGRGQFFSAGNPQDLIDQLSSILSSIQERASTPTPAAVNASVATVGALSFNTGHNADWSGVLQAVVLNSDGTVGDVLWPLPTTHGILDGVVASGRNIYTGAYNGGTYSAFAFTAANAASLDATESSAGNAAASPPVPSAGLQSPALAGGNDTVANRINYLRGDQTYEADGTFRTRGHILGAIIHSQPVYVSYPDGGYVNAWPTGSPEIQPAAQSYDAFVAAHASRPGTVYVGANDGMLHAFNAPVPVCTAFAAGVCTTYNTGTDPGKEDWAFIPRAVYANLGNLTSASNFNFRATVDATPVTRDVFFTGDNHWHTILVGGVGVGGRGVYALDITDPTSFSASDVLWEFDSDMSIADLAEAGGCFASYGSCRPTDLGYTVPQPNIGRLADGKWVVIVPNGYFPDCAPGKSLPTADAATCQAVAAQAPKDAAGNPYSALFVMDAETGKMIAELKTPTNISGVTSFGLATPVMGDYQGDQIDDVAFAGDLQGNLWRFDLSSTSASGWTVTLVYKGLADANGNQGLQPITTMPRLFPDPATNRFIVVFGTGKYLGAADNGTTTTQAMMGVRDVAGTTFSQGDLTQDYLQETQDGSATLRCVTGGAGGACGPISSSPVNPIPPVGSAGGGGWLINLQVTGAGNAQLNQGERVVVSPGAIFASNTVVFETLLTGSAGNDPCNPATQGAVMALNAVTGGPAGASSLGGGNIVGGRTSNVRTSGSLPIVSALGGGQAYLPGVTLAPAGTKPIAIDAPIWRRRSWNEINEKQ